MFIWWETARKEIKFEDTREENDTWNKVTKKKEEDKSERNIFKQEGYWEVEKIKGKDGCYCGLSCTPKKI